MTRGSTVASCLFLVTVVPFASARMPQAVSPGALDEFVVIEGRCPSFFWGAIPDAVEHELVAYRLPNETPDLSSRELAYENAILHVRVPGTATAWQPDLQRCLTPGARYVWFVRGVFAAGDVGEWSYGRFFEIPSTPSPDEVANAIEVLRQFAASRTQGPRASDASAKAPSFRDAGHPEETVRRTPSATKSVTSAKTAIKATVADATGETYGVVGVSNSGDGAGLAAANTNGGPDLVLDGGLDGEPDTIVTQAGIDRTAATEQWFSLINSDAGVLSLDVEGRILGDGSGLTALDATNISTGRLTGERLPEHAPWDCRWYVGASDSETLSVVCADDRYLISGFCYTSDANCAVGWYRPVGIDSLGPGIHLPDTLNGMYCNFSGTCNAVGTPNKAIALCCKTN